ncbi:tryptophan halogenase family protein [Sphingomonas sp. PB2P19]|uniref:tryptophan halogenase family protein n=1 Tax=Sphingomonas rhamnosi TaxID=3096156 RepID=UPI002FC74D75
MTNQAVKRVVIAGGGTAGWLAAAVLSRQLGKLLDITLVESEEIGTIGVGEATIPTMRAFQSLLGVDERAFMRETKASFKLGIAFEGWTRPEDRYVHSFGQVGKSTWMGDFQHFWLAARARGDAGDLGDYCFELQAAEAGRFATDAQSPINYAYHLDAGLYARFLRSRAEADGLKRVEGKVATVEQDSETGDIRALLLESGARIEGDLFIDCTGFAALLIGKTLGVGYEDWGHWLATDRAFAVQTAAVEPARPYTRAIAHDAGWRWKIPLQHRVGNGLIYASAHLSDDDARARLLDAVEGEVLIEPRQIRYRTGRRLRVWEKNCVALSLASGFVEPLESTTLHLIMTGLTRLMQQFPSEGISEAVVARYNAQSQRELESVRDFIILHYHLNQRDEPFWRERREMTIPDSLRARIALFEEAAQAYQSGDDLFRVDSWLQVMLGQGLQPRTHHPMARIMPAEQLARALGDIRTNIGAAVAKLPQHQAFLDRYCAPA